MARREGSAPTPALRALVAAGVPHALRPYAHEAAAAARDGYGAEAAAALGVEPARVLKTLVADLDGQLVLAVVPVSGRLDVKALAAALGGRRAAVTAPAAAERATGGVVGAISPLGLRRPLRTAVDASALAHATVLVSAGRRGLDVELDPHDLVALTSATTAVLSAR